MNGKLTAKQEAFLNGLKEGKTQYQSFIDAGYSVKNKSRNYIDKEASILANSRKISERLKIYRQEKAEEIKKKDLWDTETAAKALKWAVGMAQAAINKKGFTTANQKAFNDSIKELNNIFGINYETQLKAAAAELLPQDTDQVIIIEGGESLED